MVSTTDRSAVWGASELARELQDAGAVRFGEFTLASGASSDVYVDVKRAWTDPRRLAGLARALAAHVRDEELLAGMELGAVPLVVAVALLVGKPYVVLRKAAKEHGTRQAFEGDIPPGASVLLIEDVTTSGGSTARSVEIVRAAGGRVERAVAVVDREAGAAERLGVAGVHLEPLVTLSQLRAARR
jgi:orotate phosphoribosyltransferase